MKPHFPKVRRHIQRAFLAWYAEHQDTVPLPLQYVRRKDEYLAFTLKGLQPAITFGLTWELAVYVVWQGKCWDLLASFESWPQHSAGGYYCELCKPAAGALFDSREALWQKQVFDPFLQWLNECLLPSRFLGLYTVGRASTYAKLLIELDPEAYRLLPIWIQEKTNSG